MSFEVSEESISEAVGLSTEGDSWFKKIPFEVDLIIFLFLGHESQDWSKGIHQNSLKQE